MTIGGLRWVRWFWRHTASKRTHTRSWHVAPVPEITGRYQESFLALEDLAAAPSQLTEFIERASESFTAG